MLGAKLDTYLKIKMKLEVALHPSITFTFYRLTIVNVCVNTRYTIKAETRRILDICLAILKKKN